jgi:hypothetical protein
VVFIIESPDIGLHKCNVNISDQSVVVHGREQGLRCLLGVRWLSHSGAENVDAGLWNSIPFDPVLKYKTSNPMGLRGSDFVLATEASAKVGLEYLNESAFAKRFWRRSRGRGCLDPSLTNWLSVSICGSNLRVTEVITSRFWTKLFNSYDANIVKNEESRLINEQVYTVKNEVTCSYFNPV